MVSEVCSEVITEATELSRAARPHPNPFLTVMGEGPMVRPATRAPVSPRMRRRAGGSGSLQGGRM